MFVTLTNSASIQLKYDKIMLNIRFHEVKKQTIIKSSKIDK